MIRRGLGKRSKLPWLFCSTSPSPTQSNSLLSSRNGTRLLILTVLVSPLWTICQAISWSHVVPEGYVSQITNNVDSNCLNFCLPLSSTRIANKPHPRRMSPCQYQMLFLSEIFPNCPYLPSEFCCPKGEQCSRFNMAAQGDHRKRCWRSLWNWGAKLRHFWTRNLSFWGKSMFCAKKKEMPYKNYNSMRIVPNILNSLLTIRLKGQTFHAAHLTT